MWSLSACEYTDGAELAQPPAAHRSHPNIDDVHTPIRPGRVVINCTVQAENGAEGSRLGGSSGPPPPSGDTHLKEGCATSI